MGRYSDPSTSPSQIYYEHTITIVHTICNCYCISYHRFRIGCGIAFKKSIIAKTNQFLELRLSKKKMTKRGDLILIRLPK